MSDATTFSTWLTSAGKSIAVDDAPHLLQPGVTLDGWRVISFIARGGNAEVYRAEHTELKTIAAIKISIADTSESLARFKLEAQILGSIHHEALPVFHAFGEKNGHAYIVTEFLHPLELPRADRNVAKFATDIANALDALHANGIVHRDIKPGNVMTRNGHDPVLVDLGYAKRIAMSTGKQQSLSIEQSHLVGLGTPGYAAPEQFTGEEITPASDIHALGVLLNECFDGKPPRHWKRIIAKCTSSLPDYRFHAAQEFIQAIRHRNLRRMLLRTLCAVLVFKIIHIRVTVQAVETVVECGCGIDSDAGAAVGISWLSDEEIKQKVKEAEEFAEADKDTLYSVTNVMENKTWMSYRSDRLIVIHPSEVTTLEFCQVPMANDTIYCFIKTDSAPEAESCIYIYNKVWECLKKVNLGEYADIQFPDTLSDEKRSELKKMIELKMYSATIDRNDSETLIIRQSLPLLSEEEKMRYKGFDLQTKVKISTIFLK